MSPPTGEAEGRGPVRQGLWVDAVGVRAQVIMSALQLMNPDGAPGWPHEAPVQAEKIN